ncbi:MAG: FixJ family two-component response regulator [Paraglaciecola sp.]|jgi:FixJ family two-component response regulator
MSNGTVYIIDDEYEVRLTLENIFRFAGFEIKSFATAKEALTQELKTIDSCIVLDLNMPDMGGLKFQQKLHEMGVQIPIVVYTGKADVNSAVMAMSDGAFTLVQKPAPNHVLVENVLQAITNFKLTESHRRQCREAHKALETLTHRELEIAELVANGFTASQVADKLFISARTAEAHKASIFHKLQLKSVALLAQLVLLADMVEH